MKKVIFILMILILSLIVIAQDEYRGDFIFNYDMHQSAYKYGCGWFCEQEALKVANKCHEAQKAKQAADPDYKIPTGICERIKFNTINKETCGDVCEAFNTERLREDRKYQDKIREIDEDIKNLNTLPETEDRDIKINEKLDQREKEIERYNDHKWFYDRSWEIIPEKALEYLWIKQKNEMWKAIEKSNKLSQTDKESIKLKLESLEKAGKSDKEMAEEKIIKMKEFLKEDITRKEAEEEIDLNKEIIKIVVAKMKIDNNYQKALDARKNNQEYNPFNDKYNNNEEWFKNNEIIPESDI